VTAQADIAPRSQTLSKATADQTHGPTILIVDDFAVDLAAARGILSEAMSCQLLQAEDGEEALDVVRQQTPNLVVTDLKMPRVDGLALVSELHRDYPLLPTVVMTNFGDEQTVVDVLAAGASSYVPKARLAENLPRVVEQVLSVSHKTRDLHDVLASKSHHVEEFTLETNPRLISPLANHLESQVAHMWDRTGHHSFQLSVALQEALTNAVYHGNLGVDSELRQDGSDTYWDLAEARSQLSPWADRRLHVKVQITVERAEFVIRDEGVGFEPSQVSSPLNDDNVDRLSGRGIFLMRQFMDSVAYADNGREVTLTLTRRLQAGDTEESS